MKMRLGMALTAALAAVTGFTRPASAAHCGCTGEPAATSAGLFNGQIAAGFANLFGGLGSGSSNGCTATETQYKDVTVTEMRPVKLLLCELSPSPVKSRLASAVAARICLPM